MQNGCCNVCQSMLKVLQRITVLNTSGVRRFYNSLSVLPTMASGRLESESFKKLLTPSLLKLEKLFADNGYNLRLVGGVVRDLLLGKAPKDVDLATECTPDDMIRLFDSQGIRYIPTGLEHGTVTVHVENTGTDYEITTLRVDRETDGRHALVNFTTDWRLDAERRDLTINAMSLDFNGTLYDYFEGQRHLAEKRVLFVGDATSRIKEDYLRILRYFRFYGRIVPSAGQHDAETLEAICSLAHGLENISVERIWMEVRRIVTGGHAPHLIRTMYSTRVAKYIGGSLYVCQFNDHSLRHKYTPTHKYKYMHTHKQIHANTQHVQSLIHACTQITNT